MNTIDLKAGDMADEAPKLHFEVDAILLDIEGTISSIAFVRDVLFAYSRMHLESYVAAHRGAPELEDILRDVAGLAGRADPVVTLAGWQARDEKIAPLKKLQGMIWEGGYRSGALRSCLFPDALSALRDWYAHDIPLYIYSSGSRQAQDLFFEFNEAGDIRFLFRNFFDTGIGAKSDPDSYRRICASVRAEPTGIVFLSDNAAELEAASAAGLLTVQVTRDDTRADPRFAQIGNYADIRIVSAGGA